MWWVQSWFEICIQRFSNLYSNVQILFRSDSSQLIVFKVFEICIQMFKCFSEAAPSQLRSIVREFSNSLSLNPPCIYIYTRAMQDILPALHQPTVHSLPVLCIYIYIPEQCKTSCLHYTSPLYTHCLCYVYIYIYIYIYQSNARHLACITPAHSTLTACAMYIKTEKTFKNEQRSKDAAAKKDLIQVE